MLAQDGGWEVNAEALVLPTFSQFFLFHTPCPLQQPCYPEVSVYWGGGEGKIMGVRG